MEAEVSLNQEVEAILGLDQSRPMIMMSNRMTVMQIDLYLYMQT